VALAAANPWGTDINPGAGPALIESVRPDLAEIVNAKEDARPALIEAFVAEKGAATIEAVKRFRNPELRPLFRALLEHDDWRVKHRAMTVLEHYGDQLAFIPIWPLLEDPEPRLREKAAIACIHLWVGRIAANAAGDMPEKAIERLRAKETDPHVAAALDALARRAAGKLPVQRVHEEHVETRDDGLMITPFISGLHETKTKAPGYTKKLSSQGGGGKATKMDPLRPWTTPLILMGEEVVSGTSLQPFANLRQNGKVYHTGLDVGAAMDGAGYYAAADGVVRMIHAGSDMGTMLVVQHHLGDKRLVNAVYMHGGGTVFVKGGEKVVSGQLLGTMGMSYSIENGGHYAHLHYGLYPGSFSETHNYGYRGVPAGLVDWYDPAHYLPVWREMTAQLVAVPPGGDGALPKASKPLASGKYASAYAVAQKAGEPGDALRQALEAAVEGAPKRAERIRDLGYPSAALAFLQRHAKSCKGIPGAEDLAALGKAWKASPAFKAALKNEARLLAAEAEALDELGGQGAPSAAKARYEALLEELGDTCLRPRLEALIRGTGVR
jgi:murein DD-endopeptidase MepM/ murein hydrolase activator NlpD